MNTSCRILKNAFFVALASVGFSAASYAQSRRPNADLKKGLKDYYKDYFPIGVAVSVNNLHGDEASFILKQFNSLTPEKFNENGAYSSTRKLL